MGVRKTHMGPGRPSGAVPGPTRAGSRSRHLRDLDARHMRSVVEERPRSVEHLANVAGQAAAVRACQLDIERLVIEVDIKRRLRVVDSAFCCLLCSTLELQHSVRVVLGHGRHQSPLHNTYAMTLHADRHTAASISSVVISSLIVFLLC